MSINSYSLLIRFTMVLTNLSLSIGHKQTSYLVLIDSDAITQIVKIHFIQVN